MKLRNLVFGMAYFSCFGLGVAQEVEFLDSAKAAEAEGDYLGALQIYEEALNTHPDLEYEIRGILQSYYDEFDFQDEAKANKYRLKVLDSLANSSKTSTQAPQFTEEVSVETINEGIGFYGQIKLGYQNWKKKELYQNLSNVQSYFYGNLGYNWMWGSWTHDFSMGTTWSLEDDGNLDKKDYGILGHIADLNYSLLKGSWNSYVGLQQGYAVGVLSSAKKSKTTSTADTSTTLTMGLSYDQELASGSVLSYAFDLYSVHDQTREWNFGVRNRPKWNAWSLGLEVTMGQTKDLYDNYIQDVYRIPKMGKQVGNVLAVDTNNLTTVLNSLSNDSISFLNDQYGQNFLTLAVAPRYKTDFGLQFDLNLRTSYYREIEKEKYYTLDGEVFAGSVYKMSDSSFALTELKLAAAPNVMEFKKLKENSQNPAWLNLSIRPGLKYTLAGSWVAGLWYNYVFDLYRKDYKHYPVGTGSKYYSSSWGGSISYNF